jgi:AmmeMemoRadiSam system protein B
VPVDSDLAAQLAHAFPSLREDALAHESEHSLEVQLPFLQALRPDIRIVPVVLATDRYPVLEELGLAIAQVVKAEKSKEQNDGVLVIASSDMNHYENDAVTREKDEQAVRCILDLNPRGLFNEVRAHGITMCGYAATVAMLVAMRELGAENAELLAYGTSGDVNGDRERVVGYAGIAIR